MVFVSSSSPGATCVPCSRGPGEGQVSSCMARCNEWWILSVCAAVSCDVLPCTIGAVHGLSCRHRDLPVAWVPWLLLLVLQMMRPAPAGCCQPPRAGMQSGSLQVQHTAQGVLESISQRRCQCPGAAHVAGMPSVHVAMNVAYSPHTYFTSHPVSLHKCSAPAMSMGFSDSLYWSSLRSLSSLQNVTSTQLCSARQEVPHEW